MIEAFPLQWPAGWPRTTRRREAPYRVSFAIARDEAVREVAKMGGRAVVVSTNVSLRRDGLPYAGMPDRIDDPGVAVYWTINATSDRPARPMVIACDQWTTVRANLRACGLTIEALRMIARTGASSILDRAYQAFAALPAPATGWRVVLGFRDSEQPTREQIGTRYRELAKSAHPDVAGGSHEAMLRLTAARDEALGAVPR